MTPFTPLMTLFQEIQGTLSAKFPITCASDEFYYFPQVKADKPQWDQWDQFSPEAAAETVAQLSAWESRLDMLGDHPADSSAEIDRRLLKKMVRTLAEQLSIVRTWQTQPTFYLTIACVGMAEALAENDPHAGRKRAKGLAGFIDQAARNLDAVPELFRELGLEMIPNTRKYFQLLTHRLPEMESVLEALGRFEAVLKEIKTVETFQFPMAVVERLVKDHVNTGMDTQAISDALDEEITGIRHILELTAAAQAPSLSWEEVLARIPPPPVDHRGLMGLYRDQVSGLAAHCVEKDLVSAELVAQCPVKVAPVPDFLSATRTASSYGIAPLHPPTGGTFYVFNAANPEEAGRSYQREHHILCAHETWPGHHLLDISRWQLESPIRRVVEQPLFYEGWACFAEELMRQTGYLHTGSDLLQLARRRLWRAMRGKVDLGLQSGAMDIDTAAQYLSQTGMELSRARSSARKYTLNPGYQLCYTVGLRYFLDLFENFGWDRPQWFAGKVLAQGEIDFKDLKDCLAG
jgi:Bacterial protein of unknown function (DUF885)